MTDPREVTTKIKFYTAGSLDSGEGRALKSALLTALAHCPKDKLSEQERAAVDRLLYLESES